MGRIEDLEKLTLPICRAEHARRYRGGGAILALAGRVDFDRVAPKIEQLFGDFNGVGPKPTVAPRQSGRRHFQEQNSEQTHIGLAYDSILQTHPDYYPMRVAIEILGGGTSGRLFTELREKRGLVYNVWAGYSSLKGLGAIFGYAGTSNDQAQATLDCFLAELHRLSLGVTRAEVERARIGLKASTIIEAESTSSRSGGLAQDYFLLGRTRTLEEIAAAIDQVTVDRVNDYLKRNDPANITIVMVGPKELKCPA
jgi:predicted Zn-dependent peptidase